MTNETTQPCLTGSQADECAAFAPPPLETQIATQECVLPADMDTYQLIENHGVIGNMRSAAVIAVDGTIDFFCYPSFDSPTVFASLLDSEKGGCFQIQPQIEEPRHKQMYLPDTNILISRYLSDSGVAEVTDFMPVEADGNRSAYADLVVRMVRVVKGSVSFKVRCSPRFDYARSTHRTEVRKGAICFHPANTGLSSMALYSTAPLFVDGLDAVAEFTLKKGEQASFAFGCMKSEELETTELLAPEPVQQCFQETTLYWREWISKSAYRGRWREIVNRSALVLKVLFSQKHGSTIAAATFGLPEAVGSGRNWDYRYTWLRDSSFSLYALVRLGFSQEVRAYTNWLRARVLDGLSKDTVDGPLRPLYRTDGGNDLDEIELSHLSGYKNSQPVRIGNRASSQLQLDIYGEVMDAIYLANKYSDGISKDGWRRICELMGWLCQNWNRPDEGIWEVRGERRHLLHSRLMSWVAFDRAIRLSHKRSLESPLGEWYEARRLINDEILNDFWNEELQSFVQAKGSGEIDAALLLMPMLRFISPTDPRWLSTLSRIETCLSEDGLVFRYPRGSDALEGEEGNFTACSFWLVECLARSHQIEKAQLLFEKILGYANHLGLYSEQLGSGGEHRGNMPQALTHLALISAASSLNRALDGTKDTWV
jgi:GH15 family glucan-1,4-alpha-glucosidase